MRIPTTSLLFAGLLHVLACSDSPIAAAGLEQGPDLRRAGPLARVTVMTQNLYVGADVDAVLAALASTDPDDDLAALITAIETFQKTDFPTRAGAFADAIARERPHVVGLQEVSDVDIDLTELGLDVVFSQKFMPILEAELEARGLNYVVAAIVKNFSATPVPGVTLVDYDAMLVDASRVSIENVRAQLFSTNLGVVAPGVELKRGLVEVAAEIDGQRYNFLSTHLEPDIGGIDLSALRAAQAWEAAVAVLGDASPAFIMGDLNDVPGSLMYRALQGAGFVDAWTALRPAVDGYTSPRSADLADRRNELSKRIDYIWVRGLGHPGEGLLGRIERLGVRPWERVQGPYYTMWPSDHAGLLADLGAPPPSLR